jgi:hypothetical protein
MTTYSHDLSLNDSEMIAISKALEMYSEYCTQQLSSGPKAPYWAHKKAIERIQARLFSNARQTSGIIFMEKGNG